jgi:hypothetical protein
VTTLTALALLAHKNLAAEGSVFVGGISLSLWVLAVAVIVDTFFHLRRASAHGAAAPAT